MVHRIHDNAAQYILSRVCRGPLMSDDLRDIYVEALACCALQNHFPDACWMPSEEGMPWDLENENHIKIQVKQAAALAPGLGSEGLVRARLPSFDIHPGTTGRQCHIFVFAWHWENDPKVADQRDASQWQFCVVPEDELPEPAPERKTQTISLKRLQTLAVRLGLGPAVPFRDLAYTVSHIASVILEADLVDARLAEEAIEKNRSGEERTHSAEEVRANLGLDC